MISFQLQQRHLKRVGFNNDKEALEKYRELRKKNPNLSPEQIKNKALGIKQPRKTTSTRKKSLREQYMGKTPGKNTRTGMKVIARMKEEGKISKNGKMFKYGKLIQRRDKKWKCQMNYMIKYQS